MNMKHIAVSLLTLISTPLFADECHYPHNQPLLLGDNSHRIVHQTAYRTWDDWVWRGPEYQCPARSPENCKYVFNKTHTTEYSWAVGGTLNLENIPVIGKYMPGSITGSYNKNKSLTTSYNWEVSVRPGDFAKPIQVVTRRWMRGVYRGAYVQTGAMCNGSSKWVLSPRPSRHSMYRWDPNKITDQWKTNVAVRTYATYHVHR
ncbi:hypothetical protein [Acinetobacter pollinis]|uniref:hypothetical protein n=1 Tax=Acinetobacter pollinis TaxID=2605270 RepID=UPI0018A2810F|nr:hypothetical protein [Acinetobacter pollinis]MBF7689845.1 hypothetical protein [Acinetobacter pollinis]MBF7697303.1 hypothetical protein [Acinetobacter pollinis]